MNKSHDHAEGPVSATGDSSARLCMDVIGDIWSKTNHRSQKDFEKAVRNQLQDFTDSKVLLNDLYMQQVKERDIQKNGASKGATAIEEFKNKSDCR